MKGMKMRFEHGRGQHGFAHGGEKYFGRMAAKMMMGGRFGGPFGEGFGGWGDGPSHGRGGGRGGPGGGGRRGGRMFAGGELRVLLLHLVAQAPRHGYDLIRAIEELAGGEYAPSPGVVYPTLSLLVDEGLIAEAAGDGPRKAFAATDAGHAEIKARSEDVEAIIARLRALGEKREREDSPPVRRAMANLGAVLRGRVASGGLDTETAHQIAEILDEAARRIERL